MDEQNSTVFQAFEWDIPADQQHWQRLRRVLPQLSSIGVSSLWLPPACKAGNPRGNGYDIYDLYDLGEFEQKGSRSTKWGSKKDLQALASDARRLKLGLIFDAVLNHRCGGDGMERVKVVEIDQDDRRKVVSKPYDVDAWLKFDFPGRHGTYSGMRYGWRQFNATDWDHRTRKNAIFKIIDGGKDWAHDVDKTEHGNADYLLMNNLDYTDKKLQDDVKQWGAWIVKELGLAGFRLDAIQHFSHKFSNEWMTHVQSKSNEPLFFVGEFWSGNVQLLTHWLDASPAGLHLYDAPLLYNLARTSWSKKPDLSSIFDQTLVQARPQSAVTLVMSHDTQRGQAMDTPLKPSFIPLAYALILLRKEGVPCVFYGDMFGICPPHPQPPTCLGKLPDLILARQLYAYGEQVDYFDGKYCIGWVRKGVSEGVKKRAGVAIAMSWLPSEQSSPNANAAVGARGIFGWFRGFASMRRGRLSSTSGLLQKRMHVGEEHAGEIWSDILRRKPANVTIGQDGFGVFPCDGNSIGIYVWEKAEGRQRFPLDLRVDIYS